MALLLHIESATAVCSVALSDGGQIVAEKIHTAGQNHAKLLTVLVEQLFAECNYSLSDIDAVAVSKGPGSYTGLRIGTSVAKGICYALGVSLIAVNTLQVIANQPEIEQGVYYCPMIDARRMEVYCQLFDADLHALSDVEAKVLDESSFEDILQEHKIVFLGDGAAKFHEICQHPNAQFLENKIPVASQMASLAEQAFAKEEFVDVAYFTPFYLKKYQVTTSKKRFF